jgi:hypothetical protein
VSRYELIRRRIVPIAFLAAIALLGYKTCRAEQRTHATVELDFGAAHARVRAVDVELVSGGEAIARFQRSALPGMMIDPCRFEVAMPDEHGELRLEVDVGERRVRLVRRLAAIEGSTVTVPLERDLQ